MTSRREGYGNKPQPNVPPPVVTSPPASPPPPPGTAPTRMWRVLSEVHDERLRQDMKWGGPEHDDRHTLGDWHEFIRLRLVNVGYAPRETLIEIAALAVAAVESIDRRASVRSERDGAE